MLVQSINSSVHFGGAKEIDAIAKKYARTPQDRQLAELAKIAQEAEFEITSDGEYSIPEEKAKVDTFQKAVKESKNDKLAFYLLGDFKNTSGNFYMPTTIAKSIMKGIAQRSDKISKQEVLDHLV